MLGLWRSFTMSARSVPTNQEGIIRCVCLVEVYMRHLHHGPGRADLCDCVFIPTMLSPCLALACVPCGPYKTLVKEVHTFNKCYGGFWCRLQIMPEKTLFLLRHVLRDCICNMKHQISEHIEL